MKNSIRTTLFKTYSLFIIVLMLCSAFVFYYFFSNSLKKNAADTLKAECENISTQVYTKLNRLNALSKHIVISKPLKDLFYEDLYSSSLAGAHNRRSFSDMLFSASDYDLNDLFLYFYDMEGRRIYVGTTATFSREDSGFLPVFTSSVLESEGRMVLLSPHTDDWGRSSEPVISLCRSFSPDGSLPHTAVLEIQLPFSALADILDKTRDSYDGLYQVSVLDSDGNLIYPAQTGDSGQLKDSAVYWEQIQADTAQGSLLTTKNADSEPAFFTYFTSPEFGWTIITETPRAELLAPSVHFRNMLFILVSVVLLLILIISYYLARSLTVPIQKLRSIAAHINLRHLSDRSIPEYTSRYDELNQLYESFYDMNHSLKMSLDEIVSLRSHEIQTKLLALQSQMNPHFLYNTLTTVSILAENKCTDEIVNICDDLSSLLRYISSNSELESVPLSAEIKQTVSYINIMKIRYQDRLNFSIDITKDMNRIQVPKLIIQPLVENSIKYGTRVTHPWVVHVRGWTDETRWYIQVQDNGPGFSSEKLDKLNHSFSSITAKAPLPKLEIDGMGLLNLYTRLYLIYKENFVFKIESPALGGSIITIGGSKEEAYTHEFK